MAFKPCYLSHILLEEQGDQQVIFITEKDGKRRIPIVIGPLEATAIDRAVLGEAGLTTWVKTSGNRGLHIFAPITPDHEFLDVRHGVIAAAREVERRMPTLATTSWWKEERGDRVFLDYNQAARDRTMAGAYSPRPLPHASVSCPVEWDELDELDASALTVRSVPVRLADVGDPWAGMRNSPGTIDVLLDWWKRDLDDGLGELVFPPEYPKMPGEPPRVQPSKAKKTG